MASPAYGQQPPYPKPACARGRRPLGGIGCLVTLTLMLLALGCKKSPAVTVEQLFHAEIADRNQLEEITPPFCEELPEARYPEHVPLQQRPERVEIRVDFLLDEWGRSDRLEATVLSDVEHPQPFVDSALAAAGSIHCIPATRPPREKAGEKVPMTIAYRSALLFRFVRDERSVVVGPARQAANAT